jgi:hypothetical protein
MKLAGPVHDDRLLRCSQGKQQDLVGETGLGAVVAPSARSRIRSAPSRFS